MKPPENRFQQSAGRRALEDETAEPTQGAPHVLDVDGQVTYAGESPLKVTVFGEEYAFSEVGGVRVVQIRDVAYQLVRIQGRDQLVPASV